MVVVVVVYTCSHPWYGSELTANELNLILIVLLLLLLLLLSSCGPTTRNSASSPQSDSDTDEEKEEYVEISNEEKVKQLVRWSAQTQLYKDASRLLTDLQNQEAAREAAKKEKQKVKVFIF